MNFRPFPAARGARLRTRAPLFPVLYLLFCPFVVVPGSATLHAGDPIQEPQTVGKAAERRVLVAHDSAHADSRANP